MYICDISFKEEVQHVVVQELRQFGIKHRQKKNNTNKSDKVINANKRIFKVPLHQLPTENVTLAHGCTIQVPKFVHEACTLIRENIQLEGLFRKAGSNKRQKEIKNMLDRKGGGLTNEHHVIDIANVLKLFFRELPEPLIPYLYHDTLLHCLRLEKNRAIKSILNTCLLTPSAHLHTLMYVMEFLQSVAAASETNKMDANNLSIILTPSLMPTVESHLKNERFTHHVRVIHVLITNATNIGFVTEDLIEKLVHPPLVVDRDDERKKKKKRRSGSLTRMFNGLKKIVSGTSSPPPDLVANTPCINKSSAKRKASPPPSESLALSNKKKRAVLNLLPESHILPEYQTTPLRAPTKPKRTSLSRWFLSSTPSIQGEEPMKRSYLMLSGRRQHKNKNSTEDDNGALRCLERRWSAVSTSSVWGKKKKQSTVTSISKSPTPTTDETNSKQVEEEYVRIPKQEYEEIKSRVSAIETRLSKEFDNLVDDVQVKYEQTLEEASSLNNTPSTDQLAKRLSRELKIRPKVIRSPSARKISNIRRRSRESVGSGDSGGTYPRSAGLKRGRPNTVFTGLPHPSPALVIDHQPPLVSSLGTPEQKVQRSKSLSTTPTVEWNSGDKFFANNSLTRTPSVESSRASVARLRCENAGMVLAKAKLFEIDQHTPKRKKSPKKLMNNQKENDYENIPVVIKQKLVTKSPKSLKKTLTMSERRRTPLRGIHGLQAATPRRCSPRLLARAARDRSSIINNQ